MAVEGIKTVYVKAGDKAIELDHSYLGISKADIKNLRGALTALWASNRAQLNYEEESQPEIDVTVTQAGQDLITSLTGLVKDETTGLYGPNETGILPTVSVAVVAPAFAVDKDFIWYFGNCNATASTVSLSTNTASKRNITSDAITFKANFDEKLGKKYLTGEIDKDGAESVLQKLGWSSIEKNSGEYKDTNATTTTTANGGSIDKAN